MNRSGEIVAWLLEQISSGRLCAGDKIPSEYELADRFNINKTTANKAVAELVNKGYLRRCRGAAGTVVIKNSTFPRGNIGFYMTLGRVSYFSRLLAGAQRCALGRGYALQFYDSDPNVEQRFLLDCLRNGRLDGLIVSHMNIVPNDMPFPVIYVNDLPGFENANWIKQDNYSGGYQLGRHLAMLGHRQVAFVRQNNVAAALRDRYEGFAQAMAEAGAPVPHSYVFDGVLGRLDIMWEHLRGNTPGLTAIACDGDNVAVQFYYYLRDHGIRVPEDISLSGFSLLPEVQSLVRITTVDEKPLEVGYHAASLLIDFIEGKRSPPASEIIPLDLKVGSTTCPPRR